MTSATKPEVRFFYLRDEARMPVACVASVADTDTIVRYAVATHNPLDHYNRELARALAFYRLHTQPCHVSGITPDTNVHETIVCAIADDTKMPTRTRAAATRHMLTLVTAKAKSIATAAATAPEEPPKTEEESTPDARFSQSSIHYMPPQGKDYGFPKPYRPYNHEHIISTLVRDGYPEALAKANYRCVQYLTRDQATASLMSSTPASNETSTQPTTAG